MKKTLLMIHGMQGTNWCWENYIAFFEARGYECIAPNLRHHEEGVADPRLGETSINDYLEDLESLLVQLPKETVIMGHSMGGLLALLLNDRGYGSQCVAITPATPYGIFTISYETLKAFIRVFDQWAFWRKPFKLDYKSIKNSVFNLFSEEMAREHYDHFVHESGRALCEIAFWFLDSKQTTRLYSKHPVSPVLVVGAKKDRTMPVRYIRSLVQKHRFQYKEFPDHAHAILGEAGWEKVAEEIDQWINKP